MTSVQVTTWFLQMTDPARLAEAPEPDPELEVRQVELPSPELSRMLYTAVGGDWYWTDRLGWSWERWHDYVARPEFETWVGWVRGAPAGFFELERQDQAVELVSFGLLPAFTGRGLGKRLLDAALRRAWALGPERVWVHTCSLDGPAALSNYRARGLEVYDEQTAARAVSDEPPGPWPGARPLTHPRHRPRARP